MSVSVTFPNVSTSIRRNLPELFLKAAGNESERPFLLWREKDQILSLSRCAALEQVAGIALGLRKSGILPGDRVGILAPSSPQWLLFDLACLCLGAVTVPLFSNLAPQNLAWEICDSGLKGVLIHNQQEVEWIKTSIPHSVDCYSVLPVVGARCLSELFVSVDNPSAWIEEQALAIDPTSPATIIYTSGSTGRPKGVLLSHKALCFQVHGAQKRFPTDSQTDLALSCLPLAHVFERMVAYFNLANGYPLAVSLDVQRVGEDLKIFQPTILTVVPRLLEKMLAKIEAGVEGAGPLKKWIGRAALLEARRPGHFLSSVMASVLDPLAWSKIREGLGGRLRLVVSGGAPLLPEIEGCLARMGIPVYQGYGMTELSPVIAANFPGATKRGSVGLPFPGVELRIAPDGEVLVRSPSILLGFWNDAQAKSNVVDAEGWLATGDLGRLDPEGFLFLTGRKKDLCKTAGGKYVAPVPIEDAICLHPWIEHAVVAADNRKFVSALLAINLKEVQNSLSNRGAHPILSDYLASRDFQTQIERHLQKVNHGLNEWEQVRRWTVADRPFLIETGELTPTLKVRRSEVLVRYQSQLDALYNA